MENVKRDLEISASSMESKTSSATNSSAALSEAQLKMFQEAYNLFDKNQDGGITMNEFGEVMHALGVVLSASDLVEMFEKVDIDGSGLIEFDEFLHIMKSQFETPGQDESDKHNDANERWRDAFKLFDLDADGYISAEELGTIHAIILTRRASVQHLFDITVRGAWTNAMLNVLLFRHCPCQHGGELDEC